MASIHTIIVLIAIVVIFLAILAIGKFQQVKFTSVKIGDATVNAEIADTQPKQVRGLMFRKNLPKNDGMLFVFSREGKHGMWMMNTSILLDIIWLDKRKKVVYIEKNVKPCDALLICPTYAPDSNAKYVLEVNSGYAKRHGIKVGSVSKFKV